MKNEAMEKAIDRLAALVDNGSLLAATNPAGMLDAVSDEIERLRKADGDLLEKEIVVLKGLLLSAVLYRRRKREQTWESRARQALGIAKAKGGS